MQTSDPHTVVDSSPSLFNSAEWLTDNQSNRLIIEIEAGLAAFDEVSLSFANV
jgi:hypothetical protein